MLLSAENHTYASTVDLCSETLRGIRFHMDSKFVQKQRGYILLQDKYGSEKTTIYHAFYVLPETPEILENVQALLEKRKKNHFS